MDMRDVFEFFHFNLFPNPRNTTAVCKHYSVKEQDSRVSGRVSPSAGSDQGNCLIFLYEWQIDEAYFCLRSPFSNPKMRV